MTSPGEEWRPRVAAPVFRQVRAIRSIQLANRIAGVRWIALDHPELTRFELQVASRFLALVRLAPTCSYNAMLGTPALVVVVTSDRGCHQGLIASRGASPGAPVRSLGSSLIGFAGATSCIHGKTRAVRARNSSAETRCRGS
jgi:hypothetical protein